MFVVRFVRRGVGSFETVFCFIFCWRVFVVLVSGFRFAFRLFFFGFRFLCVVCRERFGVVCDCSD